MYEDQIFDDKTDHKCCVKDWWKIEFSSRSFVNLDNFKNEKK